MVIASGKVMPLGVVNTLKQNHKTEAQASGTLTLPLYLPVNSLAAFLSDAIYQKMPDNVT